VGVEEEFLLLWPRGDVACVAPEVLAAVAAGVGAHAEYNRCQVEAATGVRSGLATVGRELSVARRALAQAAADLGARLVASGTPPCDAPGVASLTDDPRYRRLVAMVAGLCRAAVMGAVADELAGLPVPAVTDRQRVAAAYAAAWRGLSAVVVDPELAVDGRRPAGSSPSC
jgi:hypothetical protein